MPPINGENGDDNVSEQQNNEQQQNNNETQNENPLASTGSEAWDKLIDDVAGTGANAGAKEQQNDASGKTAQNQNKEGTQEQQSQGKQTTDPNAQQRQGTPQDQSNQQTRSVARKFGDSFQAGTDGNIYDANGALIAKQGAQRAVFHRMWPGIEAQQRELNTTRERLKNYEESNALAKREGLTLDEHGAALQMFVQYKKDPVKTLNTLLTMAEQAGRDVSTLRQSSGPSVTDIRSAVQEIVADAIKPFGFLTAEREQQLQHQQMLEEVQTEYNAFLEEFPDAKQHEAAIANVMRDKQVNSREAYYAIRAFAATNGLDWNKPLAEQLIAREQKRSNPSGDGQNRQMPRIGGRSAREESHVENGALDQANANDSWDKIARQSMRKHGIQI